MCILPCPFLVPPFRQSRSGKDSYFRRNIFTVLWEVRIVLTYLKHLPELVEEVLEKLWIVVFVLVEYDTISKILIIGLPIPLVQFTNVVKIFMNHDLIWALKLDINIAYTSQWMQCQYSDYAPVFVTAAGVAVHPSDQCRILITHCRYCILLITTASYYCILLITHWHW